MIRLVLKLLWLFTPAVLAVYGFPFAVLALSGELMPVSTVVRRQVNSDRLVLYGPSYSNPVKVLKLSALLYRKPSVVVLGTSRVMQFRSQMFKAPADFYNAGGAVATLWELRPFLHRIPVGQEPDVIIVGLDQYLFNANFAEFKASNPAVETTWTELVQNARWTVYRDYRDGKFTLPPLFWKQSVTHRIGLNAIVNNNGFRNDGSYYYGRFIANPGDNTNDDAGFRNTFERIRAGTSRFEYGRHVSPEALEELVRFVKACRARGVHVVAFLPPFAHAVYTRMMALGDKYGYLRELPSVLAPALAAHGYALFDFSDLTSVGASDIETIDGFHASERAYIRLLLAMSVGDAILRTHLADAKFLKAALEAESPYLVFDNEGI